MRHYASSSASSSRPPSPSPSSSSSSSSSSSASSSGPSDSALGSPSSSLPSSGVNKRKRSPSSAAGQQDEPADGASGGKKGQGELAKCLWDDCGRTFGELGVFIDHITKDHIGTSRTTYTCEWTTCPRKGKTQTSRFALLSHLRSHTGEKPFTCPEPQCDKSFTRSDALAKHTRVQHPSLVPQSNASRSAGSSAAKTAFEAMLSIFPGGYPKGTGKRWEEEEEDWSRLDQSLGGKGKVPDRVEFTEDVVPSRTIAGKKKTKKSAGKKKKKRGDDSSSDLTEWEDDSVDELALLPPGGEEVVDPDGGGAGSDSDDSLSSYLLPPPLLVKAPGSKPPIVQKYILAKGLHRSSLATRAGLEADLKQLEVELKRVRESKDKALNDLLYREFGSDADAFILQPTLPPKPSPSHTAHSRARSSNVDQSEYEEGDTTILGDAEMVDELGE